MDAAIAEDQSYTQLESQQICVWKTILENSLNGLGTSFDPANLNTVVIPCVDCNGSDSACRRYQP